MKKLLSIAMVFFSTTLFAQLSLDVFNACYQEKPKPIIIQFTTDWCGYCFMQDRHLAKNNQLTSFIDEHFYYLKIDAESFETLNFLGNVYPSHSTTAKKSTHSLLYAFTDKAEQPGYPYWIVLNTNLQVDLTYSGYIKPKNLQQLLQKYLN